MSIARFASKLVASLRRQQTDKGPSAEELTREGISCLEKNDAVGAIDAFRQALEVEYGTAARQVNLAFALQQAGHHADARYHLQRAVGLDSQSFDAAYMLGCEHERDGDLEEAALALRQALALRPDYVQAHADLGRVLAAKGKFKEARTAVEAGLQLDPSNHALRLYMGNIAMGEGQPAQALSQYEQALVLQPQAAEAHANRGRALHALGQFESAVVSLKTALSIDDRSAQAHAQLAISLYAQGNLNESELAIEAALAIQPQHGDAMLYKGILHAGQGRLEESIVAYRAMIRSHPDSAAAHGNLGAVLFDRGEIEAAVPCYRVALALSELPEVHDNLGNALVRLCAVDEAIQHFKRALALDPDNLNTQCNLAVALGEAGRPDEAIQTYRDVLRADPQHLQAHANLLFNLSVDAGCAPREYLAEARIFETKLVKAATPTITAISARSHEGLRVGFVSGDIRIHPVGFFLEGVLQALQGKGLTLYAYPTTAHEDHLTARVRPLFANWRRLKGLDDEAAARLIREDGIDILIDLSGYTSQNRLPLFARRPAPLQVAWLGYFASTGLSFMDYVLADDACVPLGNEWQFSEKVWRLPETRLCFTPPQQEQAALVADAPALARGHLTFGSFQRLPKLNDEVLALWGRVLAAIPTSRLWVHSHQTGHAAQAERLLTRLEQVGIGRERVTLRGPSNYADYLKSYADVDIVLDSFPYTGGTTTCEALWMGVPTLTLNGDTMISRQGMAMLRAAALPEWVADDTEAYVQKAVAFAADVPALVSLRRDLRQRTMASALFDTQRFAHNFAIALNGMWQAQFGTGRPWTVDAFGQKLPPMGGPHDVSRHL